ncbi:putative phage abortive infection protein [Chryseolinea soli]|uniref:Phage abortive infection protein n=1 Tax=Chryseolinea soli TaxID=2321403 RepID=A0A385SJ69_9BACT|nr:putative phage abortive infection protein [Chryseolinea soli]AYB30974.1 hypothetical protein D4L85_10455 [Chryseolinea soli]
MKNLFSITTLAYILLVAATSLTFWYLVFGGYLGGEFLRPDATKAKDIHPFVTGLVVPLLTLGSTLLVIANLQSNTAQNFSNNFFKLIDQHHKLIDNINTEIEGIGSASKGREFFDDIAERIAVDYETLCQSDAIQFKPFATLPHSQFFIVKYQPKPLYEIDERLRGRCFGKKGKELLLLIYDHFFHLHQSDLSHYFRNLYHIVRFAERSSLSNSKKLEFIKILRAQLSNYEILLIAYNGLHDYGQKFFPLIEKYELLKSLNSEDKVPEGYLKRIVDKSILMDSYPHLLRLWSPTPPQEGNQSLLYWIKPSYWQ